MSARAEALAHETTDADYEVEIVEACPVCGGASAQRIYSGLQDNVFFCAPGRWDLHRCGECQSVFISPRLTRESIHLAYQTYFTHTPPPASEEAPRGFVARMRRRAREAYLSCRYRKNATLTDSVASTLVHVTPGKRRQIDFQMRHLPRQRGSTIPD